MYLKFNPNALKRMPKIHLSENLLLLRQHNGITQSRLAGSLHIDRSTYAYYETGRSYPPVQTIVKLSYLYDIPIDQLLGLKKIRF